MTIAGKFGLTATGSSSGAQIHEFAHHGHGDTITVSDPYLLFAGDYKRSGTDLILSKDGREHVVYDYFNGHKHAALAAPDGARLSGDIIDALTGHVQYAQAAGGAPDAARVIGHVTKLAGNATVIRNGVSIVLNMGDNVHKGDVVQSGSNSQLGITFIDGTVFGLASNARMVLNDMVYDPNGSSNSSFLTLVQGTITFLAGQTAKHGDMKVDTPVATMGIRGTACVVEIDFDVQVTDPNSTVPRTIPVKFQVLQEKDGTVGSYFLYAKTDLTYSNPVATINRAGEVTAYSANGQFTVTQLTQIAPEIKAIIDQTLGLTSNPNPQSNPTPGSTPANPVNPGSPGDTTPIKDIPVGKPTIVPINVNIPSPTPDNPNATTPTPIVVTVTVLKKIDVTPVVDKANFAIADQVKISDDNPSDVLTPYVPGSGKVQSVTGPAYTPEGIDLKHFVAVDPSTGHVSYDSAAFAFLKAGDTAVVTIEFDSSAGSDTFHESLTITINGVNDAPVIENATIAVSQGGTVLLTAANIGVFDPDNTSFKFTVSNVTHGAFQTTTDGVTWVDATTFTTADLDAGHVRFVHDGTEAKPTFSIQADDGEALNHQSATVAGTVDFTNVNDAPTVTSAALTIAEGATVVLSAANIGVTDPDSDSFTFTVSNVTHGTCQTTTDGVTWVGAAAFTTADLSAGHVRFVHDGSHDALTFSIQADDGTATHNLSNVLAGNVDFTIVDSVPVINHASLTVSQGGTVTLTTADINFTDPDDSVVTYTVSNLSHGHFEIIDGNVSQTVTSFTSDDVAAGRVAFVHDGSSFVPAFSLTPSDGFADGATVPGAVTFTAANYTLISDEGIIINVSTEAATSGFVFPGAGNVTTPGIPEDRIAIGYDVGGSHVVLDNAPLLGVNQMAPLSSETHSLGDTTFVSTTLDAGHGVTLVQTLALGNHANFFTTTIDITNNGTSDISNLRFLRNFDPDQDVQAHNDYKTFNDVVQNPDGAETFAIVSATGVESGTKVAMVGLGAEWRASVFGFTNTDPYATHAFDAPVDPNGAKADLSLSLTSSLGTLTAGSHVQVTYITTNNVATAGSNALYGAAGADTIDGLGGDDLLIGLGGADTFVFKSGYGHNTIEDFSHSDGDRIDLTGVTGVHGINDLQITSSGADTIIDLGNGDSLTLANVSAASLVAGDFMFANHAARFVTDPTVTQLAVPADGVPFSHGEIFAIGPSLSSDGRYTTFGASDSIPGQGDDSSKLGDVYLYDRQTDTYKWISDPANFAHSNITLHSGETFGGLATVSLDGQTVVFRGDYQTTQTIGDQPFTFSQSEVFLYNTGTGLITLVPGLTGDEPSLSSNGNQIVSTGPSLTVPFGNTSTYNDVLVTDRAGHVLTRISGDTNASPINTTDISPDGRYVTFWTTASQIEVKNIKPTGGLLDNLTFDVGATYPADPSAPSGPIAQVYVFDRQTETINLVSVSPDGHMGNGDSGAQAIQDFNGFLDSGDDWKSEISVDDRFVLFQSNASNLVPGDTNGATDVFLYDLQTHQVQLVSVAADGSAANGMSYRPAISPDGNFIVFASDATNLLGASATPSGTDGFQTYVREIDPATGLVSTGFDGFHNGDNQYGDSVNRGGGLVAFGGAALAFNQNHQSHAELISLAAGTVKFSGGSISDYNPAADTLTITMSVLHGTLTPVVAITPGSGLTIVGGFDGSSGTVEFTGAIDAINQALQSGVVYTPTTAGPDALAMTVTDGHGGTATQTVQFDPQAPQITDSFSTGFDFIAFGSDQPQAQLLAQGQVKFFGESISDSNPGFNPDEDNLTVTVSVGHGTLTPVSLGDNLSIVGDLDGSNGILAFTGSIDDVNRAMQSGAIYTATSSGPDAITVVVTDGNGGTALQSTQFDPQAPAIDVVASGQYNVFLVDQSGGTQGVVLEDSSFSAPNSGTLFTKGAFGFTDADLTDTHTATVIGSPVVDASHAAGFIVPSGGLGTFTPLAVTESAGSGQVPWTFTVDDALVQGLGRGRYITETYAVQLDDHHGGHPTQDVTIIVAGGDDAPVIATDNLTVTQDGPDTTISGLSMSDIDTSDNHFTLTATAGSGVVTPAKDSGSLAELNSDFTNGIVYSLAGPAPVTDRVTVTVADDTGATDIVNVIFNVTGSGNVTLQGTAGKDVIFATGYQDTLTGGAGADQFVFASHTGNDTITDFTPGQDKIRLDYHAFDAAGPNDFAHWLASHAATSGGDTLIDLNADGSHPGVDTILLKNVAIASLHAGDFHTV